MRVPAAVFPARPNLFDFREIQSNRCCLIIAGKARRPPDAWSTGSTQLPINQPFENTALSNAQCGALDWLDEIAVYIVDKAFPAINNPGICIKQCANHCMPCRWWNCFSVLLWTSMQLAMVSLCLRIPICKIDDSTRDCRIARVSINRIGMNGKLPSLLF